jgi:predicted peroxiredoxin
MKRLIFFASADTRKDPDPAWRAYHFADVAARAGLEAEVRLAGDAVRLAQPDGVQASRTGEDLRKKAREGAGAPFRVSL